MNWKIWFFIFLVSVAAFFIRDWQCAEMFPQANRLACLFWK